MSWKEESLFLYHSDGVFEDFWRGFRRISTR